MKRIFAFIIALLLPAWICYATIDTLEGEELTDAATIEGVSTTDTVEGQVLKAAAAGNQWYSELATGKSGDIDADANWVVSHNDDDEAVFLDNEIVYQYDETGDKYDTYHLEYQSAANGVDQAVILELEDVDIGITTLHFGATFRSPGNSDGSYYRVTVTMEGGGGADLKWSYCTLATNGSRVPDCTNGDIATITGITTIEDGDFVGFAIVGTGNSTVIYFWNWEASPPTGCPSSCPAWDGNTGGGNWGVATDSDTTDPSDRCVDVDDPHDCCTGADAGCDIDTGNYVGMHWYTGNSAAVNYLDHWYGGDVND